MDEKLFEQIKKAAENSIKNPGQNLQPLPKSESDIYPKIYVFRHGESTDNLARVFSGWRDVDITETGEKQAEVLAEKLKDKKIDLCITSPQIRAKETEKIALKYHHNIPVEEDRRIMERDYGDLNGTSKEEMMQKDPELAIKYRRAYDFPPPNGESIQMVEKRVVPFIKELIQRIQKENINVAVSCHGNSMRVIRRYFENLPLAEMLTIENPLAQDYAQYVVSPENVLKWQMDAKSWSLDQ